MTDGFMISPCTSGKMYHSGSLRLIDDALPYHELRKRSLIHILDIACLNDDSLSTQKVDNEKIHLRNGNIVSLRCVSMKEKNKEYSDEFYNVTDKQNLRKERKALEI